MMDVLVSTSTNTVPAKEIRRLTLLEYTEMAQVTTTICSIKNASDSSIIYQISNDWQGHIGAGGLGSYPSQILSNATATFQHVGNQNGSQGAVVYRITITSTKAYDVVLAWFNQPNSSNKAYTLVSDAGFITTDSWAAIYNSLINSGTKSSSKKGGCTSEVEIGEGNFPTFSATITA